MHAASSRSTIPIGAPSTKSWVAFNELPMAIASTHRHAASSSSSTASAVLPPPRERRPCCETGAPFLLALRTSRFSLLLDANFCSNSGFKLFITSYCTEPKNLGPQEPRAPPLVDFRDRVRKSCARLPQGSVNMHANWNWNWNWFGRFEIELTERSNSKSTSTI